MKIELTDAEFDAMEVVYFRSVGYRSTIDAILGAVLPMLESRGIGPVEEHCGDVTNDEGEGYTMAAASRREINRILASRRAKYAPKPDAAVEAVRCMYEKMGPSPLMKIGIFRSPEEIVAAVREADAKAAAK